MVSKNWYLQAKINSEDVLSDLRRLNFLEMFASRERRKLLRGRDLPIACNQRAIRLMERTESPLASNIW